MQAAGSEAARSTSFMEKTVEACCVTKVFSLLKLTADR